MLDATIVNVALPHIQRALGFSGSGLEWVVTAYALAFGGLLLLGGRAGDLLGRRRVFIAGLLLFSAASLAGGFATSQAWLLSARAVQGIGGAMIAPTALALVVTTFAEGPARNRAMGVLCRDERWRRGGQPDRRRPADQLPVLAVGAVRERADRRPTAAAAPFVLPESARRRGRFDLPGAITGSSGVALLVYGLSSASTGQAGVSHWADPKVVASLAAAAVLLAAFVIIEARSSHPLMPLRILADRSRSGSYLIMLVLATAMFGLFFFLTIFVQDVLGYSALKTGLAFLPLAGAIVVVSGIASQLISRTGARPLMLAGPAVAAGGMYWFSHISVHTTYTGGLLGPSLVTGAGLGMLFVPLSLVVLTHVRDQDSGLASSLLNTGQQVGGAIGLAALGTVAWTAVADSIRSQVATPRRPPAGPAKRSRRSRAPRCPGSDLPQRPRFGHHPRVAGRLRDRAGRLRHRRDRHPGPPRGPHRPGRDRPGAAGQRRARDGASQFLTNSCSRGDAHLARQRQSSMSSPAPPAHPCSSKDSEMSTTTTTAATAIGHQLSTSHGGGRRRRSWRREPTGPLLDSLAEMAVAGQTAGDGELAAAETSGDRGATARPWPTFRRQPRAAGATTTDPPADIGVTYPWPVTPASTSNA